MSSAAGHHPFQSRNLPRLWNDRDQLVQVVTSLLSNSIKFIPQGGKIWINAKKVTANRSDGLDEKLEICVSDTESESLNWNTKISSRNSLRSARSARNF